MTEQQFADLDSNQRFEKGWNGLQTAIEVIVGLIVVAGLAGLLGTGPLSARKGAFDKVPLVIDYQGIVRRTVQTQMTIKTTAPLASDTLEIELPNELTDEIDVVSTSPRSTAMRAERDGIVYVFALGASRLGTITFSMKPRIPGFIDGVIRSGGAQAPLKALVLP